MGGDLSRLSDAADFLSLLMAPSSFKAHLLRQGGIEDTRASSTGDVVHGTGRLGGGGGGGSTDSRRVNHIGSSGESGKSGEGGEVGVGARRLLVEAARAVTEGKFNGSIEGAADLVVQRRSHDPVWTPLSTFFFF